MRSRCLLSFDWLDHMIDSSRETESAFDNNKSLRHYPMSWHTPVKLQNSCMDVLKSFAFDFRDDSLR